MERRHCGHNLLGFRGPRCRPRARPARRAPVANRCAAMKLLRGIRMSARVLFAHKVRAALALASIAVSVGAVVIVSALGEGAKQEILRQTETMGVNLLVVRPTQVKYSAARKQVRGVVTTLTEQDDEAIAVLSPVRAA